MSEAQKKATKKYQSKQVQVQAFINPEKEPDLLSRWEYLKRQFGGSNKQALAWAINHARESMDTFKVWKDGQKDGALNIRAVNMNAALDEAAHQFGYIDYADMAQELNWSDEEGLNIEQVDIPDGAFDVTVWQCDDMDDEDPVAQTMGSRK